MSKMGNTVIIAEKPSVARDLAKVVGANQQGDGCLYGNGYTVTWAIGHLVTLPEPHQINPLWKSWSFGHLPMLPKKWPLIVAEKTKSQFDVVKRELLSCSDVICATDAGREGELIFRYIYELANCTKPVKRLWISSLTADAIRAGLKDLKPGAEYDPLADAACARSRADWLYGMNLSRAYALKTNEQLFVGRVQTPTLAMVVERDLKIRNFVPEHYSVLEGQFRAPEGVYKGSYLGEKHEVPKPVSAKEKRLPRDEVRTETLLARIRNGAAKVTLVEGKSVKQPAPLLYDLTELQRHCNRVFGFSAQETLTLAQNLYEKHKLISYPRTGSRHLSKSVAETLPDIIERIRTPYEEFLSETTGRAPLSARFVDDTKVTDHHAIIPTATRPSTSSLHPDEQKVYDLICRRLLMAWQIDFATAVTTVITEVAGRDLFKTQGTMVVDLGWKALDLKGRSKTSDPELPANLVAGVPVEIEKVDSKLKQTEPPPHLTESTLLTGMESAGKNLEDKELAEYMRDSGLGTPATRAATIEALLSRQYIERKEKALVATSLGHKLIATVHPTVKSPELTARWEKMLSEIQSENSTLKTFMKELEAEVSARIQEISAMPMAARNFYANLNPPTTLQRKPAVEASRFEQTPSPIVQLSLLNQKNRDATPVADIQQLLKERFGFDSFRASQEVVCRSLIQGNDVLLVMPTGAGKSLCYQIPGIARGGTTLVISPLVALIEDQVAKLKNLKFSAERIHSGRSREESRQVCHRYLAGELDFLFIAPERLSVPGFPEFLKRQPPTLIAIDEAHCISQWGHDFRPDYRILGERLKDLRPIPVIALTATATPTVQDDICKQLGLKGEKVIQGFRRTNIAIELAELSPSDRPGAIGAILTEQGRLPAIVYTPTRKKTDELTQVLSSNLRVGSYHAGMSASARDKVQSQFLENKLDVIVATVAFGMGIDKANIRTVIHAAMPGSVEGYYQEIGRAGRDGLPSKAYLLHSFADQKTHEFFFELNYPDVAILQSIFGELDEVKIAKDRVRRKLKIDSETFDRSLEQLWVHRGVIVDPEENMSIGSKDWEASYQLQRDLRQNQLRQMSNFASSNVCRMISLVSHFGDQNDSGQPCRMCDACQPERGQSLMKRRPLYLEEKETVERILLVLERDASGIASGRLFQCLIDANVRISRGDFEKILRIMEQAGWVESHETSFEKDGKEIKYRKISIRQAAGAISQSDIETLEILGFPSQERPPKRKKSARRSKKKSRRESPRTSDSGMSPRLFEPLRAWRLGQARQKKVPAFRILTDKALYAICEKAPTTLAELEQITIINRKALAQYGEEILSVVRTN